MICIERLHDNRKINGKFRQRKLFVSNQKKKFFCLFFLGFTLKPIKMGNLLQILIHVRRSTAVDSGICGQTKKIKLKTKISIDKDLPHRIAFYVYCR